MSGRGTVTAKHKKGRNHRRPEAGGRLGSFVSPFATFAGFALKIKRTQFRDARPKRCKARPPKASAPRRRPAVFVESGTEGGGVWLLNR